MNSVARRLLTFGLLGPTLGFLMTLAVIIGFGMDLSNRTVLFVIFAYAFVAGTVPAVLTGVADWYLATRMKFSRRVLVTAGAGYFLCTLVGLTLLNRRLSIGAVLIFALFGMLAAAMCSWLSSEKQSGSKNA
jgi:hypothetical protein